MYSAAGRHPARAPGPGGLLCARRASPLYPPLCVVTLPQAPPHGAFALRAACGWLPSLRSVVPGIRRLRSFLTSAAGAQAARPPGAAAAEAWSQRSETDCRRQPEGRDERSERVNHATANRPMPRPCHASCGPPPVAANGLPTRPAASCCASRLRPQADASVVRGRGVLAQVIPCLAPHYLSDAGGSPRHAL